MKATAQQAKGGVNARSPRASGTRVQLKARPGAGNRHRADAHERQADDAAVRVMRGEEGVGRMLTPTRAAGLKIAGSRGEPLPRLLREELERGFGAELSAIRLHRDAAAHAASRAHFANAFASGPNIYFSAGAFDATSPYGRRLIAHEVAHVLQQTGRASSEGRLRATAHLSTGLVQCDAVLPPFADLRKLHKRGTDGTGKYSAVADELERLLKATDSKAQVEQYARKNLPGLGSWPERAESLLFDTLKSVQAWDTAAELIERDDYTGGTRILTAAQSDWVYDALERRYGGSGVFALALEHSTLLKAYIDEFLRLIEVFVLQPINEPVPLLYRPGTKETIAEHVERHTKALDDNTVLKGNEWFTIGLSMVRWLDDWRVKRCQELQKAASLEPGRPEVFRKRPYASGMRDWGEEIGKTEMTTKESTAGWRPQFQRIGKLVTGVGNRINKLWDRAQVFDAARTAALKAQGGKMAPDTASLIKVFDAAKAMAEKAKLPAWLAAMLDKVNEPDSHGQRPPAPEEYAERVRKLADELDELSHKNIEAPQAALFRADKLDEEVAALWLAIRLSEISRALRGGGGTTDKSALRVADVNYLIANRIWIASWVWNLAKPFAWSGVLSSAEAILDAQREASSQLALLPGPNGQVWTREENVPIERLLDDMGGVILMAEPLTFRALVLFYRLEYFRQLTQQLKSMLPDSTEAERKRIDKAVEKDLFFTTRAQTAVLDKSLQPVRYEAQHTEFAQKASSLAFIEVLRSKMPDYPWYDQEIRAGRSAYLPDGFNAEEKVAVWFVPPYGRIAATLRKSKLLQALVKGRLGPDGEKRTLSDEEWLDTLKTLDFYELSEKSQAIVIADIEGILERETQAQLDLLIPQARRATTIDRQVLARLAASQIKGRWTKHSALEWIEAFVASIQPQADHPVQLAALILDLAPVLDDASWEKTQFGIINGFLALLESALESTPSLAALPDDRRALFLPQDQNSRSWIDSRKKHLESVVSHLQSVRKNFQKEHGFYASKTENELVDFRYGFGVPSGTELLPASRTEHRGGLLDPGIIRPEFRYVFVKVLYDFEYHRPYGTSGAKVPARVLEPGTDKDVAKEEQLLEVRLGGKPLTITAGQLLNLEEIAEGVTGYASGKKLERSLVLLGAVMYLYVEAAELLPGGQVITASRLAAAINEFFLSDSYEDAKKLLGGDLGQFLKDLVGKLGDALDPETLVQVILFPDPRLDRALSAAENVDAPAARTKPRGKGRFAWIGKVFRAFRKLATGLARAAGKLHKYVQEPMQDFRSFASTRPAIAVALRFAAQNIYTLSKLASEAYLLLASTSEERKKGGEELVRNTIIEQQQGLANQVHAVLQSLEQVQLPAKIIHMEPIVTKLLNEVLAFIAGRLGWKGKIAVKVLDLPGVRDARDAITSRIAEEIVDAGLDPNKVWRETVVPEIEGHFNAARNGVVEEVNRVLKSKPFQGLFTSVPKRAPVSLKLEGDPFEETAVDLDKEETGVHEQLAEPQPYPSADRPLHLMPASVPSVGPGRRLDPAQRGSMESSFRQDFRHVRLHAGADGEAMTSQFGADAVTTGSHIFLRSGVSPQSERGEHLLRHELTHVVQQSGARPVGDRPEDAPVVGRPGRGLNWDPASEKKAERAAEGSPVVGGAGTGQADGLQPAGISLSTMADLLKAFTDLPAMEKARDQLQKETKGKKEAKLGSAQATAAVNNVLTALELKPPTVVKFPAVFTDAIPLIANRFRDTEYANSVSLAAFQIAKKALEDLPALKPAAGQPPPQSQAPDPEQVLKPGHFARQLEGFIMTRLGIGVSLKLNTEYVKAPNGDQVEVIASTNTVKEIAITYIHLPYIDGRNDLWGKAIENTWKDESKDFQQKARGLLKPLLMGKGVSLGVWAFGKVYRFSYLIRTDVEDLIKKSHTGALDPKQLPPPGEYVKTDKGLSDNIGLRLATYGHQSQWGTGRESHHLTQFLLPEYFNNTATTPAFKKARKYPGVKKNRAGEVELISKSAEPTDNASETVLVAKTKSPGRGDNMPAISLAAAVHQGPDLHITPEADEIWGDTRKTQSYAVNNQFLKEISADLHPDSKDTEFAAYVGGKDDDDVAKEIYTAVQKTYQYVEERMNKQFATYMPPKEVAYFAEMTLARDQKELDSGVADQLLNDLKAIPGPAYAHNKTEMEKLGWKL